MCAPCWLATSQDCWAANTRTADGKLQADKEQFPDGMAALVDYVHARGLKIGLYTCAGNYTCHDHRPGSYGHYTVDAETFAGWDIGTLWLPGGSEGRLWE